MYHDKRKTHKYGYHDKSKAHKYDKNLMTRTRFLHYFFPELCWFSNGRQQLSRFNTFSPLVLLENNVEKHVQPFRKKIIVIHEIFNMHAYERKNNKKISIFHSAE